MGFGDAVRGLFSRRDTPVEPLVLLPAEAEVARAVGTWRSGTLASVDGHLLLTTQRLVFATDAEGDSVVVLAWALHGPDPGRLVAVEVGADASLTGPPSLVLVDSTGRRVEIGILANRLTPNLSGANPVARDRMAVTVRSAIAIRVEQPRPAQPPPTQPPPTQPPPTQPRPTQPRRTQPQPTQPRRTQPPPTQPPPTQSRPTPPKGFSWFPNDQ